MSVRITYVNGGMKNVPMLSKVQHLELDVAHTSLYLEDAAKLMPQRPAPAPSSITVSLAIDESPNELRSFDRTNSASATEEGHTLLYAPEAVICM
mmetsp:Transcript_22779/g.91260  ORF Transcript_22779/g.91260 Transcript_22779/m.91260 type:complete len:95 (-) Transcript_22779:365-649(-)